MKKRTSTILILIGVMALSLLIFDNRGYLEALTRGLIGKQDIAMWAGGSKTFTRDTTGGYSLTLNRIDWPGVDVLHSFGGGVNRTGTAINAAISAIGTGSNATLWLSPGAWSITSSGITVPQNLSIHVPSGASLVPTSGNSFWITGPIIAGDYQIFDCSAAGSTVFASKSATSGFVNRTWWNSNVTGFGVGKIPGDLGLDVNGPVRATTFTGVGFSSLTGSATNAQLPNPLTSGVSTHETITGKTFYCDLTTSETLSGETLYGGAVGNYGSTSEVTGTIVSAVKGMSALFMLTQAQESGKTIFVKFNAADTIIGLNSAFSAGASVVQISGTTLGAYVNLEAWQNNRWYVTGVSGITYRNG